MHPTKTVITQSGSRIIFFKIITFVPKEAVFCFLELETLVEV